MSNKTQLQTNNATLDALITRVNAAKDTAASLPEAGGGGGSGGEVKTCSVTINSFATNIMNLYYCTFENGLYQYHEDLSLNVSNITLQNVICGSMVDQNNSYSFCYNVTNNENYAYFDGGFSDFRMIPTGDIVITIIDDD